MADAHFNSCSIHIERYQEAVGSCGHQILRETDAKLCEQSDDPDYDQAASALEEANERVAAMLREKTDECLSSVLLTASFGMKNGFARSDG